MTNVGISAYRTVSGPHAARSRTPKESIVRAGYLSDLSAVCVVDDQYLACEAMLNSFEAQIGRYETSHARQEKALTRKQVLVTSLAVKYGLPAESNLNDVLAAILDADKYLQLGYGLECTWNDWSEGPHAARKALGTFNVETAEDKAIHQELSALIEEGENDEDGGFTGVVFRDCQASYSAMYRKAKPEVVADFEQLRKAGLIF
jgi:hypothetical protein